MFGFPIGNGNAGFNDFVEKFTNNADSGFPKIQQREVFYSVKDGNWNDITTWQTASGRVGFFPTRNDDVYIKTNVLVPTGQNLEAGNIFVGGTIRTQGSLYCFGNFKCAGTFDGTLGGNLLLFSNDNYINIFIAGTSNITYAGNITQDIMPLSYYDLSSGIFYNSILYGQGFSRRLTSNLTISRNLNITYGTIDVIGYDLFVNGTTNINGPGGGGTLIATGTGNLTFVGELKIISAGVAIGWDFSAGNPSVECRGGIDLYNIQAGAIKTGTGTWTFSTNNQTIRSTATGGNITFSGLVVMSNVNLTVNANQTVNFNNTINATNAGNTLTNRGTINFLTDASVPSMTTGIVDFTTNANTIGYTGNYSATIPSYFTTFHNLTISGGGTKTLGVNTTLNGNLLLNGTGILQLSTYNLTVTGTTTLQNGSNQLLKSGAGNVLFIGELIRSSNGTESLDFSAGNPNVELRGGINQFGGVNWLNFKTGTGTWSFTTNNQTIQQNLTINFDCPILIVGAISLTLSTVGSADLNVGLYNTINGTVAGSTLVIGNNTSTYSTNLNLYVNTTFMTTGTVDLTKTSGKVAYLFNGNFTLPYSSYNGLVIGGTGTKSPSSNLTIGQRGLTINIGATFDLLTYNLDNATTTNINNSSNLNKTGSGNVIFGGTVTYTGNTLPSIDFSVGNPTVTVRNGLRFAATSNTAFKSGTGVWTFDTNNQSIQSGNATVTFDCPITISGAITLTHSFSSGTFSTLILKGVLNGNNASSNFTNGAGCTINYQNATQPMVTGILDTSTNLNTWIYGSGNQDIKGSPTTSPKQVYRNLTLNGGGVKTLQGYVSVQNTYTLTSPATLALNGFTLTNP